jgi:hypothetical protein
MAKNMVDTATLSVSDIEALLRAKKEEQSRIAAEKGVEARKDVEQYLQSKWGLTLTQVWMANGKPIERRTYKNPADGKSYTYSGKGKVPAWLKGTDGKPNPALEVKNN